MGVFHSLIDAAEEEECKEIILVYYHLLTSDSPLNPQELDDKIESWMLENFGKKIDFDIKNTIKGLEQIKAKIVINNLSQERSLLSCDRKGYCQVLSLDEAKELIDSVWDNFFDYAHEY
jgi:hypothetical protein